MKVPSRSDVRGDNLGRDHPTGRLIDGRGAHFHWQQLQSHSPHAGDELCKSKAGLSTFCSGRELSGLTCDTIWTRMETLGRHERGAFVVRHGRGILEEYGIPILVVRGQATNDLEGRNGTSQVGVFLPYFQDVTSLIS